MGFEKYLDISIYQEEAILFMAIINCKPSFLFWNLNYIIITDVGLQIKCKNLEDLSYLVLQQEHKSIKW